jgi:hypothetical protein
MVVQRSGCAITRILKKERLKINPSVTELLKCIEKASLLTTVG